MAGNFLAACNEYEAGSKLIEEGRVQPPAPSFAVAMDTNFGVRYHAYRISTIVVVASVGEERTAPATAEDSLPPRRPKRMHHPAPTLSLTHCSIASHGVSMAH